MSAGALDAASLTALSTALAGRYRIEREIGAGGMATVLLGHDLRHDREVAIKVLHSDLGTMLGAERFLMEIRTTARLQHPHILPLLDSGETAEGLLFYVMPFVRGETLRARLDRERQLAIPDAIRIARETADALGHAHAHGIVHRDVKPENILLQDGHAMVADFGIALAVQQAGGRRITGTGVALGTPHYMSPEQAMGERIVDARTDVYALGAVTYEMLAGVPPFTGANTQAIVGQVMTVAPDAPSRYRDTVPAPLDDVVLRALAKLPADRWPTTAAFAGALADAEAALHGGATNAARSARATNRSRHESGTTRGESWRPWTIAVAAVVGAAATAGAMWSRSGASSPVRSAGAVMRTIVAMPDSEALAPTLPLPATALSPRGDRLFYVHAVAGGRAQLRVRYMDRLRSEALPRAVGDACCIAASPTGDTIAYLAGAGRFEVQPLAGGAPRALSDSGLHAINNFGGGLAWGADGMLYVGAVEGLLRVDPRTDARTVVSRLDAARGDRMLLWPSLLPDGKGAIVTVLPASLGDRTTSRIGIADFATGALTIVETGIRAIWSPSGHLLVVRSNGVLTAVPFDLDRRQATGRGIELPDTLYTRASAFGTGAADLALAPDGTLFYVGGDEGRFELVSVDRAGSWKPIAESFRFVTFNGMSLSPNGRTVALAAIDPEYRVGLWIVPLDGAPARRGENSGGGITRPRWHPGTDSLTFGAFGDSGSLRFQLRATALGASTSIPVRMTEQRAVGGHAWSPDGRWLLVRTEDQQPGRGDILAVRAGDTVARPIVATPAEEMAPAISPDGRWMAYSSDESGRREVYVRGFPDARGTPVQISGDGGWTPVWSRDGRELFFVDGARRMAVAAVVPGATFRASPPRALFPLDGYRLNPWQAMFEVLPDGRFLMGRQSRRTELRLVVVTRYLDEIARRAK